MTTGAYLDEETEFAFGEWSTPFENASLHIHEAALSRGARVDEVPGLLDRPLSKCLNAGKNELIVRIRIIDAGTFFRVRFAQVSAFRLLDEHGLVDFWLKTKELGGRPAQTTFKVRNSLWVKESPLSFLPTDGWSYVIATDWDCVEVVTDQTPIIEIEEPA